jgi:hypothetical protein
VLGEIAPELEARYREAIADGHDSAWLGLAEILALQGRTEAAAECLDAAAQAGHHEALIGVAVLARVSSRPSDPARAA